VTEESRCLIRKCKHYEGIISLQGLRDVHSCKAFPRGIPVDISYGNNSHTFPICGDRGVQYKRSEESV